MENENRNHLRVAINWPVEIQTHEQSLDGVTGNISNGGVFIRCNGLVVPRREILSMLLKPPNRTALEIIVTTVWKHVCISPDDDIEAICLGTRFLEMSYVDRQFLSTIIFDYLKEEYEKESSTSKISHWPFMTFDRIELHKFKCHLCKVHFLIGPAEKTCPICGIFLPQK
ncbi:MAG: PilZ domain-containing protein [Candidatus Hermodarchaeota archaeon]